MKKLIKILETQAKGVMKKVFITPEHFPEFKGKDYYGNRIGNFTFSGHDDNGNQIWNNKLN